jgi:hypothetical protein
MLVHHPILFGDHAQRGMLVPILRASRADAVAPDPPGGWRRWLSTRVRVIPRSGLSVPQRHSVRLLS